MKDEIKEMINEIKEIIDGYLETHKLKDDMMYDTINYKASQWYKLLDYITNLQEENERLKELCDKYEEEHSTAFKIWTMKMKEMPDYEEKLNYKSRCKKAIEYIENNKKETSSCFNGKEYVYRNFTLCCEPNDLLNILKGSEINE